MHNAKVLPGPGATPTTLAAAGGSRTAASPAACQRAPDQGQGSRAVTAAQASLGPWEGGGVGIRGCPCRIQRGLLAPAPSRPRSLRPAAQAWLLCWLRPRRGREAESRRVWDLASGWRPAGSMPLMPDSSPGSDCLCLAAQDRYSMLQPKSDNQSMHWQRAQESLPSFHQLVVTPAGASTRGCQRGGTHRPGQRWSRALAPAPALG